MARKLEKSHSASLGVMGTTQPEAAMREPASRHRIGRRGEGLVSSSWQDVEPQSCPVLLVEVEISRTTSESSWALGSEVELYQCLHLWTSTREIWHKGARSLAECCPRGIL